MNKLVLILTLCSASVFAQPVNINTADAKTISASLVGVGLKKAEAIVAERTQHGGFKSVDDLKRVSGIGEKTIAANKTDILLSNINTTTRHARTRQRHGHTHSRKN